MRRSIRVTRLLGGACLWLSLMCAPRLAVADDAPVIPTPGQCCEVLPDSVSVIDLVGAGILDAYTLLI